MTYFASTGFTPHARTAQTTAPRPQQPLATARLGRGRSAIRTPCGAITSKTAARIVFGTSGGETGAGMNERGGWPFALR